MINKEAQNAYITSILAAKEIAAKHVPVLCQMIDRSYYNEDDGCMEIVVNTYTKKKIAEKAELKSASPVNSAIAAFLDNRLLSCVDNGAYRFSPEFFGNRDWHDVVEITLGFVYDKDGVTPFRSIDYGDGPLVMEGNDGADDREPDMTVDDYEDDDAEPEQPEDDNGDDDGWEDYHDADDGDGDDKYDEDEDNDEDDDENGDGENGNAGSTQSSAYMNLPEGPDTDGFVPPELEHHYTREEFER